MQATELLRIHNSSSDVDLSYKSTRQRFIIKGNDGGSDYNCVNNRYVRCR